MILIFLKPLKLTLATYESGSIWQYLLAHFTIFPIFILVSIATLFLFKRDLSYLSFGAGLVGNEMISYVLKRLVRQPRPFFPGSFFSFLKIISQIIPKDTCFTMGETDYGMPSSHSQFVAFFLIIVCMRLRKAKFGHGVWKSFLMCLTFLGCLLTWIGRVQLGYHSLNQVMVGILLGLALGFFWYLFSESVLRRCLFPLLENSSIGKYFYLIDFGDEVLGLSIEYNTKMTLKKKELEKKAKN